MPFVKPYKNRKFFWSFQISWVTSICRKSRASGPYWFEFQVMFNSESRGFSLFRLDFWWLETKKQQCCCGSKSVPLVVESHYTETFCSWDVRPEFSSSKNVLYKKIFEYAKYCVSSHVMYRNWCKIFKTGNSWWNNILLLFAQKIKALLKLP